MARPAKRGGTRPYRPKVDGKVDENAMFVLKVKDSTGKWVNRSTGTPHLETADRIADMMNEMRKSGQWKLIDQVARLNEMTLMQLYAAMDTQKNSAVVDGQKVTLSLHSVADAVLRNKANKSLAELAVEWGKPKKGRAPHPAYVRDVGYFIDWLKDTKPGVASTDAFTAKNAKACIDSYDPTHELYAGHPLSGETRRKIRVALSQFGKWLTFHEHITANPISKRSGVEIHFTRKEKAARSMPKFYTLADIERMIAKLDAADPLRAVIAMAFSGAMEWQALERTRVSDVGLRGKRIIHAHGSKSQNHADDSRDREVVITHDFCWDAIVAYKKTLAPGTEWFFPRATPPKRVKKAIKKRETPRMIEKVLRDALVALCDELHVEHEGFHKFRHSFAVYWIEAGCERGQAAEGPKFTKTWCKTQMGHKPNSVLFDTTYGKISRKGDADEMADALEQAPTRRPKPHGGRQNGRQLKFAARG